MALFQIQISDRSFEVLENPGFDDGWTGSTPNGWTKTEAGSSVITEETTILRPGSTGSATRFTYDNGSSTARLEQSYTLIPGAWYHIRIYYIYEVEAAQLHTSVRLKDSGSNIWLDESNGGFEWSDTTKNILLPVCSTWAYLDIDFQAHESYSNYVLWLSAGSQISAAYIIIDEVEFRLDTSFYALPTTTSWNGAQWLGDLKNDSVNISKNLAYRGDFEESNLSLTILDQDGKIAKVLADFEEGKVIGREMIAREDDGSIIQKYKLMAHETGANIISYHFGDSFNELKDNFINPKLKAVPADSIGYNIPYFSGQWQVATAGRAGDENYIQARRWRDKKDAPGAQDGLYIIGQSVQDIVPWSGTQDFQYVITPDGIDVTSFCTLITPTLTDPYHYVSYSNVKPDEKSLYVHFKYPAITPEEMIYEIGELLFEDYKFNTANIAGKLGLNGRHFEMTAGGAQDWNDCHFLVDCEITRLEVLRYICETFGLSYHVNSGREITFEIFDYLNIYRPALTTLLNERVASAFNPTTKLNINYDDMVNQTFLMWSYGGKCELEKRFPFNNLESQKRHGAIRNKIIESAYLPGINDIGQEMAHIVSKLLMAEKFSGEKFITFDKISLKQPIDNSGKTILDIAVPFKIWKFKHKIFNDDNFHYLQIRRVNLQYPGSTASIDFVDVTDLAKFDIEASVLLQSNNDNGDKSFKDGAVNDFHWWWNNSESVEHSNAVPLFGKSSIRNVGTTPDLKLGYYGRTTNLVMFQDLSALDIESIDISFFINFNTTGSIERIVGQRNGSNYWSIFKLADDRIRFVIFYPTQIISMTSTTALTYAKWYFVLFYRDNAKAALYINENQETYSTTSLDYAFTSPVTVYNNGLDPAGQYMDAHIQSLRISPRNGYLIADRAKGWFNCNPNASLTDKIVIPTGLMSSAFREYWIGG